MAEGLDGRKVARDLFPFEDLEVWKEAVSFANQCLDAVEKMRLNGRHYRLLSQLEAACTSPCLNSAERKGRFSKKEFVQFLYIARGSIYETVTLLMLFHQRGWIHDATLNDLKNQAACLSKRVNALINSIKSSQSETKPQKP